MILASLTNMLEAGLENSQSTAKSWDKVWDDIFDGGSFAGETLFGNMTQLGLLFALVGIVIAAVLIHNDLANQRGPKWTFLVWPLIAMILFADNGSVLGTTIIGLRNVVNQISDQIAASTLFGIRLDQAVKDVGGAIGFRTLIENNYRECVTMAGEARVACLESAAESAEIYADVFGNEFGPVGWIGDVVDTFREAGSAIMSGEGFSGLGLFSPIWQPIVFAIMFAFMEAYQNLLEAVMVLMGLIAPLAVGGSIIGFGTPALVGWLSGLMAMGLAKILFNLLIGLSAAVINLSGVKDPNWFPFFVGLGAPIISFTLGSGSGYVIWSSVTTMISNTAGGAASLISRKA